MIQHIVMWKFLDFAEGRTKAENMAHVKTLLEALVPVIPEIISLSVHADIGQDEGNLDMALVTTFDIPETLAVYQAHPCHQEVSKYVSKVRLARAAVDFVIPAP